MRNRTMVGLIGTLLATGAIVAGGAVSAGAVGNDDAAAIQSRGGDDGPGDDNGGDRARDRQVRHAGTCTVRSTSKIKVKEEDRGRLGVEFEVDQNRNGQKWGVVLKRNGAVVARTSALTRAPSGSFSVERLIGDRAGADTVTGVARNTGTGETCTARVVLVAA
jgi:hypothetical protein